MHLKQCWYPAAVAQEITSNPQEVLICGELIVLYRDTKDEIVALSNACSHRRAPLSLGKVKGDEIECPYHGLRFDSGGRCVHIPVQSQIPDRAHIRAFPVRERWGMIWIWMGAPESADEAMIPSMPWIDDPQWNSDLLFYYHVPTAHTLVMDNLLDLGHASYIHAGTVGVDPAEVNVDPLNSRVEGDTVRNTRTFHQIKPAPVTAMWGNFKGLVDRVIDSVWSPPANMNIHSFASDENNQIEIHFDHMIAPETDSSHHYWIRISRNFRIDDAELTDKFRQSSSMVHKEDIDIALAQQRLCTLLPDRQDMPIRQDRGLVAAHKILSRLLRQEQGDPPSSLAEDETLTA